MEPRPSITLGRERIHDDLAPLRLALRMRLPLSRIRASGKANCLLFCGRQGFDSFSSLLLIQHYTRHAAAMFEHVKGIIPGHQPQATLLDDEKRGTPTNREDLEADEEFKGVELLDRKMILINREIDRIGMGRYQWCLFTLCGFGYLLDLAFAQLFGLILSPITVELGVPVARQVCRTGDYHNAIVLSLAVF